MEIIMKELKVNIPHREYNIYIGSNTLSKADEIISEHLKGKKVAIVTDANVKKLYAKKLGCILNGYDTKLITVDAGETSKSLETLQYVYGELLSFDITRADLIVALGGGVVGDLTGFAAATLLRGIGFIQIPTTLLAQVDSSIGGKTAVNLPWGKNLVGSFCQPKAVIIDTETLKTLPDNVLSDGMAEVIKYGAICDKALFEKLEKISSKKELFENIEDIIYNCCNIKREIVEEDEFDTGKRMILNFGHTFGHAIEKANDFQRVTHGMAVAAGMVMASKWGEERDITPNDIHKRIENILRNFDLPVSFEVKKEELLKSVSLDKKSEGENINLILLKDIGNAIIYKTDKSKI